MYRPDGTVRHVRLCCSLVAVAALSGCHRIGHDPRSVAGVSDSAQAAELAITEFRRLSHDSGAVVVISFLRHGDSVVIYLAPGGPPGEMTWRPGGSFVVHKGTVIAASLIK